MIQEERDKRWGGGDRAMLGERQGQVQRGQVKGQRGQGRRVTPLPPTALLRAADPGDTVHAPVTASQKAAGVGRGSRRTAGRCGCPGCHTSMCPASSCSRPLLSLQGLLKPQPPPPHQHCGSSGWWVPNWSPNIPDDHIGVIPHFIKEKSGGMRRLSVFPKCARALG